MGKVWTWLNGNKMAIGTLMIALNASLLYGEHTVVYIIFSYLGPLLAGGGLIHKMVKPAESNS